MLFPSLQNMFKRWTAKKTISVPAQVQSTGLSFTVINSFVDVLKELNLTVVVENGTAFIHTDKKLIVCSDMLALNTNKGIHLNPSTLDPDELELQYTQAQQPPSDQKRVHIPFSQRLHNRCQYSKHVNKKGFKKNHRNCVCKHNH